LLLFHGVHKALHGTAFVRNALADAGLPEFIAPAVFLGEIVAPALLIVGVWSRLAGLVAAGTMAFAIFLAFRDKLFTLNQSGGWIIELNILFLVGALAVTFLGGGKFALRRDGLWD
jgi:putative oxidoreductase